ncbi:cytochrome b [Rickettsiella grylli]|uniref:Cytochrome b561 transmembrane protein n=1 Tax=Rickettsiella grylli TaxID=59196 RepID=A8PMC3_9COXI|nr:cytochrome b [Rickettsiella grylli]EDP45674.1 cytochrome b561 transmembrane protein [Rickettsiella grylli]OJA00169.1 hypothetical protein BEV13_04320 [Rickettsiella grylli]
MLKNTVTIYGSVTKFFHWLMVVLIISMFIIAYTMINIPTSSFSDNLYKLHKATGLLIFGLVVLRLFWHVINVTPKLPPSIPFWQRRLAAFNVIALYLFMFLMPITGFFMSSFSQHAISFYGIFTLPPLANKPLVAQFFAKAHEIIAYLFIASLILHVIGAFYHPVLKRMWVLPKSSTMENNK